MERSSVDTEGRLWVGEWPERKTGVAGGLRVNEGEVVANLDMQLPLMVMEAVMMGAAGAGADRQVVHERIRGHALEAALRMAEGEDGGLFERVAGDEGLGVNAGEL